MSGGPPFAIPSEDHRAIPARTQRCDLGFLISEADKISAGCQRVGPPRCQNAVEHFRRPSAILHEFAAAFAALMIFDMPSAEPSP